MCRSKPQKSFLDAGKSILKKPTTIMVTLLLISVAESFTIVQNHYTNMEDAQVSELDVENIESTIELVRKDLPDIVKAENLPKLELFGRKTNNNNNLDSLLESESLDDLKILVKNGAEVNYQDEDGSILHSAVKNENPDNLIFLAEKVSMMSTQDNTGRTPPHVAALHSSLKGLQSLTKNGGDLYYRDHNVISREKMAKIENILNLRASVNSILKDAVMTLLFPEEPKDLKILELSMRLSYADGNEKSENSDFLLRKGLNVNEGNNRGLPVFQNAAERSGMDYVKFLFKNEADVNHVDNNSKPVVTYVLGKNDIHKYFFNDEAK